LQHDELVAAAMALPTPAHCAGCGRAFRDEVIWRRVEEMMLGPVVIALCEPCNQRIPRGSLAELPLIAKAEGEVLAALIAQGHA
jgi:hypothetical protein